MRTTAMSAFAVCLLLTFTHTGTAQTVGSQEHLEAVLALKRAGAFGITGKGGVTKVSLSGLKSADLLLERVRVLKDLESLELADTNVTDTSLEKIKGLTKLNSLNLASTKIGDEGLQHLKDLTALTELSLVGTQVSDEGVQHLKGLSKLRTVIVNQAKVTSAGANTLREALPGVTVIGAK